MASPRASSWWLQEPPAPPAPFAQSGFCYKCGERLHCLFEVAEDECYDCTCGHIEGHERDEYD